MQWDTWPTVLNIKYFSLSHVFLMEMTKAHPMNHRMFAVFKLGRSLAMINIRQKFKSRACVWSEEIYLKSINYNNFYNRKGKTANNLSIAVIPLVICAL